MPQVRVYNDNTHVYRENFMGKEIVIPAGEYITMDEGEAIRFRGSYSPIIKDGSGVPKRESFKMIRLVKEQDAPPAVAASPKFICQFDNREFGTQKELDDYIDANHLDKLADKEYAEKRRKQLKK